MDSWLEVDDWLLVFSGIFGSGFSSGYLDSRSTIQRCNTIPAAHSFFDYWVLFVDFWKITSITGSKDIDSADYIGLMCLTDGNF